MSIEIIGCARLAAAVLEIAKKDVRTRYGDDVAAFVKSEQFLAYCDGLGLDPEATRREILRGSK